MDVPRSTPTQQQRSLFPGVFGKTWSALDPLLQRSYSRPGVRRSSGRLDVRGGEGRIARILARWLGLPAPGEALEAKLAIYPGGAGETWCRTIGEGRLVTRQRRGAEGLLVERFACLELTFALVAARGGLHFRQRLAALACGRLRLRLPAWLAPRVAAREEPAPDGRHTRIHVLIDLPLAGRLTEYRGWMQDEEDPC